MISPPPCFEAKTVQRVANRRVYYALPPLPNFTAQKQEQIISSWMRTSCFTYGLGLVPELADL
jgi:hypothetical protein